MPNGEKDLIRAALKRSRPVILTAIGLSFVINLLGIAVPLYSMQVFDRVLSSGSKDTLVMLTLIVALAVVSGGVLSGLRAVAFAQVSRWLDDAMSAQIVRKMLALALYRPNIGAQPLRDLASIRAIVSSPTLGQVLDAPWAILFFIVLFLINVKIGLLTLVAGVALLGLAVLAQRAPSRRIATANEAQVRAYQSIESVVRNAEVVRAMGMSGPASAEWLAQNQTALDHGYRAANIGALITNATRSFRLGLQVTVTGFGAWLVIQGQMSVGSIIAVNMLSGKALAPFDASVAVYQSWTTLTKAHKRLLAVFEFEDPASENLTLPEPKGDLSVQRLSYQERTSKRLLLQGITLDVPAGHSIGVIGPSGSGKTTLARLLVGVTPPTSGEVRLDGAALDQWRPAQLAASVGYLPQDVELFTGTVALNIARMDKTAEDADIVRAAQAAEVHDFILTLPDGYQTQIGENGAALSAGQRQRIALARCFFGAPKLIVMDEPNSNLDTEGEQALVQAMGNARALGATCVIISHRPSLLHHVDQIAVLRGGTLGLLGPAREVLEKLAAGNASARPLKMDRAS